MTQLQKSRGFFSRLVNGGLALLAALWLIIEDWLWDSLLAAMARLAQLPLIRSLEARVSRLPPYAALVVFALPALVLLPFKLAAFWLMANGKHVLGVSVFIVAKIIGTALLARIFKLTKPTLITLPWFARSYDWVIAWKLRIFDYVKSLPAVVRARRLLQLIRAKLRRRWLRTKMRLHRWWRL